MRSYVAVDETVFTDHASISVGELTLVNGNPQSADVVANAPVELLELELINIPNDIETLFLKNIAM